MTSRFSHLRFLLPFLAIMLIPAARIAATPEEEEVTPYYGDWENAQGDKLQITSGNIQVNEEKPARYDDITEDSDGSFFVLQLKDSSESGYFEGKFLRITFGKDPDRFTMSIYKTLEDALKKQNEVKHIEWSAPADEAADEPEVNGDDAEESGLSQEQPE
jgi:hypothetical protein